MSLPATQQRNSSIGKQSYSSLAESLQEQADGWQEFKFFGQKIAPRKNSSLVYYANKLYLFGGYSGNLGALNEFFKLDLLADSFKWTKVTTIGPSPGPRTLNSCNLVGSQIIIYGGQDRKGQSQSSVYKFDLEGSFWQKCKSDGQVPCGVDSHSSVIHKNTLISMLGFCSKCQQYLDSIYSFDLQSQLWRREKCEGRGPSARSSGSACIIQSQAFYLGGGRNLQRFNDLWALNLKTFTWKLVQQKTHILQRKSHSMVAFRGKLIIFGGYHDITYQLNQLLEFDFQKREWHKFDRQCLSPAPQSKQKQFGTFHKSSVTRRVSKFGINTKTKQNSTSKEDYSPNRLIFEKRKRFMTERKIQMLEKLELPKINQKSLMNVTPCSQSIKDSILIIGEQTKKNTVKQLPFGYKMVLKTSFPSKFHSALRNLQKFQQGKRPCARDGHCMAIDQTRGHLFIFGGDRHKMNFGDLYRYQIQRTD